MGETWVWSLGWEDSPGKGKGDSDLENSMDYSPWGHKELDMTDQLSLLHSHIHVCICILLHLIHTNNYVYISLFQAIVTNWFILVYFCQHFWELSIQLSSAQIHFLLWLIWLLPFPVLVSYPRIYTLNLFALMTICFGLITYINTLVLLVSCSSSEKEFFLKISILWIQYFSMSNLFIISIWILIYKQ